MTITFYKKNENKTQYYSIHDRQGDFFTPYVLTAVWGTEPDKGRVKVYSFESDEEMDKKLRFLFLQRIKKGYKILYSFTRKAHYKKMFNELEQNVSAL